MKKHLSLLVFAVICQQGIFAQTFPSSYSEYNLSPKESGEMAKRIPNYLQRVKNLSAEKIWTSGGSEAGTNGKVVNGKLHQVNIDYQTNNGDGGTQSDVTFYVRANNPATQYFPIEIVCFHYDETRHIGTITQYTEQVLNGLRVYEKDLQKLKTRFDQLVAQMNDFF